MDFPLYTSLSIGLPSKDLTVSQKRKFIKQINTLDSETCGLIYALIKSYYVEHENGDNLMSLPYSGALATDCINFDLAEFPIKLRQLLHKFVTVHSKKIKEDKEIQEIQTPM